MKDRHKPIPAGKRFGRLEVIEFAGSVPGKWWTIRYYRCRCDCGSVCEVQVSLLRSGGTRSCGCLSREVHRAAVSAAKTTHGMTNHPLYRTWAGMVDRCCNQNNPAYDRYGGRGITVCDRWKDVANFVADMGDRPSPKHSLDRIDNDGPYSPENCRWATQKEQNRNYRRNVPLTCDGRTMLMCEWAEESGVPMTTLSARIKRGWLPELAIKTPVRKGNYQRRVRS